VTASVRTLEPLTSDSEHWCTPAPVLERLRVFAAPDGIGLDPCSNAQSIVGARVAWDLARGEDALARRWAGHGLVYLNPPYGDKIGPFMQAAHVEARGHGVDIVALVPARTSADWFQRWALQADALCFWRGRLQFRGAKSSAPFSSVVVLWSGERRKGGSLLVATFEGAFASAGKVVRL
jgi:hypothetical protein